MSCRHGHPASDWVPVGVLREYRCRACHSAGKVRRRAAKLAARTQQPSPAVVAATQVPAAVAAPPVVTYSAPAVHTSRTRGEAYLVVPDTQEPYSAPGALSFVLAVAKEFGVDVTTPGHVFHVGDEVDFYAWSRFPPGAERAHTPTQEIEALRDRLRHWYAALPHVRLCHSNHGGRVIKAASNAQLPSQMIRAHREILDAPPGWEWAETWTVEASRSRFLVEHGHAGPQAVGALRQRPTLNGMSTCWGHLHA